MTEITVSTVGYQTEKRSWLIPQPGAIGPGYTPSVTLDISSFTAATHYPNGYIPSGTLLGKVTTTGLYGPYLASATDGRQTAVGFLFSSTHVRPGATKVGGAAVVAFAVVRTSKLPLSSGAGAVDSAAQTALKTIYFES